MADTNWRDTIGKVVSFEKDIPIEVAFLNDGVPRKTPFGEGVEFKVLQDDEEKDLITTSKRFLRQLAEIENLCEMNLKLTRRGEGMDITYDIEVL